MDNLSLISLLLIALVTLGMAAVALSLKNIIHCALLLVASWAGIAAFYLWAGAEFAAFAQVLVYVGAVSMVALFAVLLTRKKQIDPQAISHGTGFRELGKISAALVATVLVFAVATTPLGAGNSPDCANSCMLAGVASNAPAMSVKSIGLSLMNDHVGALMIIGVLLTVALLGAVVIASPKEENAK